SLLLMSPIMFPSLLFFLHFFFSSPVPPQHLHSFPTRRSSDLKNPEPRHSPLTVLKGSTHRSLLGPDSRGVEIPLRTIENRLGRRSEEHTSELQSRGHLVCRLLLEKQKKKTKIKT